MYKWILISASLLPMLFIGCTEHSLGGDSLPKEDVLINFSAGYVNYDIDVVSADNKELAPKETRATTEPVKMGIIGVAATENDVYADCLLGLTGESFCNNMFNAEYKGVLPGAIRSVDGLPRSFPLEEKSAVAVYAYSPYKEDVPVLGDTSCYIKLDLIEEHMLKDYAYTGKVFQKKEGFGKDDKINLQFYHAFAKVDVDFKVVYPKEASSIDLVIDTLQMGIGENGVGLFDLKNGYFYPEESEDTVFAYDLMEVRNGVNSSALNVNSTMYIPPTITLNSVKIVFRRKYREETMTRIITFDAKRYERGKKYSISITLNVPKELYL